ncbi:MULTISPECIES: hypothetical protein [Brevundimonas]|uniref:hypothetical protein n=1 Tax=Brevundimonas TaxID=41275 RepID=UPI000F036E23|nr:hypothetical protein [Brevundimonas lutea]
MTDKTLDVMSETYGRALVAETAYEKRAIWLPLLAVHTLNAGEPVIKGKTFTDCVIEGPALVAVLQGTTFEGCDMGASSDAKSLLFTPHGPRLVGAIGLQDCKFVRCRFRQIAYTGSPAFIEGMSTEITGRGGAGR